MHIVFTNQPAKIVIPVSEESNGHVWNWMSIVFSENSFFISFEKMGKKDSTQKEPNDNSMLGLIYVSRNDTLSQIKSK